ncbi:STAGA complex 65 subunit gamma-like [Gigantopelta aegis]|uniref:STAGA complex 65 subunit gamma-like n=1 Tax=Gigantopelta aegis TaxID=1735272 RepID=UPI001B88DB11|nr:STAGA complex 65 subunit gamma-like [Gigantopelta aegis]
MSVLWGEIPAVPETDSGLVAVEREQLVRPRPMEVEGPRLHQPSSRHYPPTNEHLPSEHFQIDPITLHTIRLIQHTKKMRQLINSVQQQQLENKNSDIDVSFPSAPPIPEFTGAELKHQIPKPIPFLPPEFENKFVQGIGEPPPKIDEVANRKLLRRSVAALFAHAGFDNSGESLLETMTDITHEYFLQITKHLRSAADSAALNSTSGFPDIIEQVFSEMGIGSVTCLHDFYQSRVIAYHDNMKQTCQQLVSQFEKLKQQKSKELQPDTFHVIRIKEEPCAEIQFPVLDENDAEQLLQLEGFSSYAITVEQETADGLTTEVDSKWSQGMKSENSESRVKPLEGFDEAGNLKEPVPTPQDSQMDAGEEDPGSVPVSDILSPPSITYRPSNPKKRKR